MSSDCSCTIASTSVAGTLTNGIQDIAALLPLLGTEQCEEHVSSALTKGYLYAAASPMSLFGSLGLARAGLKTFVASFSIPARSIVGARTLANMGFKPQGMNLSLIMIDPSDKNQRFLVETRLDKLVEELHVDKTKVKDVQHKAIVWKLMMIFLSAILCLFGLFPYIFLTTKIGSTLPHRTRWTFPALRIVGGFLTANTMQFVIQRRVMTLARRWISEHCSNQTAVKQGGKPTNQNTSDVEKTTGIVGASVNTLQSTPANETAVTDSNSPFTWFLLVLLLLGILASIVGYVGCFSVVQSANRSTGPLSWLCLEAGLSLLRMFLWGYNPGFDDVPPLRLILARDPHPPLPTCKLYDHDIETEKILPLTRANQFLNQITSFTGVVERFDHPDLTLYYTLTRKAVAHADPHVTTLHELGEHVLYITIFDHKERANTRVYTQRGGADHFLATESSLPVIDPKQGLLEIKLGNEVDNQDDPITNDHDIRSTLHIHYLSIMNQLQRAMAISELGLTFIESKWTMAMVHTTNTPRRKGGTIWEPTEHTVKLSARDFLYFQHGLIEKNIQSLCSARGEWIATYMHWARGMKERFMSQTSTGMASFVDEAPTGPAKAEGKRRMLADETETSHLHVKLDQEDIEDQVIDQMRRMELLLVEEMQIWEENFRDLAHKFIGRDDVLEKTRLTKEWKSGFLTRLKTDIRAMEARFDTALEVKASCSDKLTRKWQSMHGDVLKAWQALAKTPRRSSPPMAMSCLEPLQTQYQNSARDIEAIIRWSKVTAAQREQLRHQSEVASQSAIQLREAFFWMDGTHKLTEHKLSRSKWGGIDVRRFRPEPPVRGVFIPAMNGTIFVCFFNVDSDDDYALVAELIRDLPSSVTSIHVPNSHRLPAIQRDTPLFINDTERSPSNDIKTFFHDNRSLLERTHRTHVFINTCRSWVYNVGLAGLTVNRFEIAISFFGPPSGNLVLKLATDAISVVLVLEDPESHVLRRFTYSQDAASEITLFPSPSHHPTFVPNTRNNLTIEVDDSACTIHDIQLHDKAGNDYNAASAEE